MRNRIFAITFALSFSAQGAVTPKAKTLYMKDTDVAQITVTLGRSTILNFPARPTKIVLGNKNHFAVEYIESDVAISALHPTARCNLVVYLQGRRFTFDLTTSGGPNSEIFLIRDGYLRSNQTQWKSKRK